MGGNSSCDGSSKMTFSCLTMEALGLAGPFFLSNIGLWEALIAC